MIYVAVLLGLLNFTLLMTAVTWKLNRTNESLEQISKTLGHVLNVTTSVVEADKPTAMQGLWEVCTVDGANQWHHLGWVREDTKAWKEAWLDPNKGLQRDGKTERGYDGHTTV